MNSITPCPNDAGGKGFELIPVKPSWDFLLHFYSVSAVCSAGNLSYHKEKLQTPDLSLGVTWQVCP